MNYSANDPDDLVRRKIDLDHIENMSKLKINFRKKKKEKCEQVLVWWWDKLFKIL